MFPSTAGGQEILTNKRHLLKMIVSNLLPLELTQNSNFQDFINALKPSFRIPPEMSSLLNSVYEEQKEELRQNLKSVDDLVLTCELWSSRPENSYLTVSCHFVDGFGNLKSYVLKTTSMLGHDSPASIQNELSAVMEAWGIKEKVHSVVRAGMPQMKGVKAKWLHMPCFADTLNVIFRGLMSNDEISNVLGKCHNIVRFFKYNSEAEQKLRHFQNQLGLRQDKLILHSGDQWLAWLHMLQPLHDQYLVIVMVLNEKGKTDLSLNENEKKKLDNIISALEPLKKATSKMKTKGFETIAVMVPLLKELMDSLEKEKTNNDVAQKLLSQCRKEFGDINKTRLATITFLDPRFKNQLGEQNRKQAMEKITKELIEGRVLSPAKIKDLLDRYMAYKPNPQGSNPLAWWRNTGKKNFGELGKLALKKLGVVSTVVPLERAFSGAGDQFSKLRSCIEPENLNMILFLNSNWSTESI